MHSSQNEQDNRYFALAAKIPCLEPADSQEAKDMVAYGLEISEQFDTPVMLRTTTRVSHSQSLVTVGERQQHPLKEYVKDPQKFVMVPGHARARRLAVEERTQKLKEYSETTPLNFIQWHDRTVGVIASGISYQYVREVLPNASILKLGFTHPLPEKMIRQFASQVDKLFVVEELEPFLELQIKALGIDIIGKEIIPGIGELTPRIVAEAFKKAGLTVAEQYQQPVVPLVDETAPAIPGRPPVLCAGCPHRAIFHVLRSLKLIVTGDIGCYTLGSQPPLSSIDTCICMGASVGMAHGMVLANPAQQNKTVAVIGDSTFLHSGITGLMDMVYNGGSGTLIILDNSTTAMTGHQQHPATGSTLMGRPAPKVDLEALVRALGIKRVQVVDPVDIKTFTTMVKEETAANEPSVIIARRPCVLLKTSPKTPVQVEQQQCSSCKLCLKLGCPAISFAETVVVNPLQCGGCGLCVAVCPKGALTKEGEANA
jgi:indolepyruvate ferredoxin oxidoreductase alpha subunit